MDNPPAVLPHLQIFLKLHNTARAMRQALDNGLNKGQTRGVDYDMAMILLSIKYNHTASIKEVQGLVGRDLSLVSRDISSLVKRGLLFKGRAQHDHRVHHVQLSPAGLRVAEEVEQSMDTILRAALANLRLRDQEDLVILLNDVFASTIRLHQPPSFLD